MKSIEKVLSCHTGGNFITATDLQIKEVTPEDVEAFCRKFDLVWEAFSLGPVLGNIAMFYNEIP